MQIGPAVSRLRTLSLQASTDFIAGDPKLKPQNPFSLSTEPRSSGPEFQDAPVGTRRHPFFLTSLSVPASFRAWGLILGLSALVLPLAQSQTGGQASTDTALDRAIKKAKGKSPATPTTKKKGGSKGQAQELPPLSPLPPDNAPAAPLTQQYSFALYQIWYRGGDAQTRMSLLFRDPDGTSRLTHLPLEGAGPWLDSAKSSWHQTAFADMGQTGVNVALVQYRPDEVSRAEWGRRGVDMAVQALRNLRSKGTSAPGLALYLDFNGRPSLDLSNPADRDAFYGVIREFYLRIPRPYRASVMVPGGENWPNAVPVFLSEPKGITGISADWLSDLRARFKQEFDVPLAVAGDASWKANAPGMDAFFDMDPQKPLGVDDSGSLHTALLTPGYNERGVIEDEPVRSRLNSRPYVAAWNDVSKRNPDWIMLNSWNGFREGTEVTVSRENGNRDLNLTRGALADIDSRVPLRARLIGQTVPNLVQPGSLTRVDFYVSNAGVQPWPAATSYLRYQWMKGDSAVGRGETVMIREVRPRQETNMGFLLPARTQEGPLAEGDYRLRVTLAVPAAGTNPPSQLSLGDYSVHVGQRPEMGATLIESETPALMQGGETYPIHIKLRNDGSEVWNKADYAVRYRWIKVSDVDGDTASSPMFALKFALRSALRADIAPGTLADLTANVAAKDDEGKPLEAWTPDKPWHYELEWTVVGTKGEAEASDHDIVEVVDQNPGVDFPLGSGAPHEMDADKPYELKVVVKNNGPARWKPGQVQIGYRWYYWDGVPMNWDSQKVEVKGPLGELSPGEQTLVRIPLQSPPFSGMFLIGVDALVDGAWASASPTLGGGASTPSAVVVSGGGLRPLPINPLYNIDGISADILSSDGDFDGEKFTFPGQLLPPLVTPSDIQGSFYPSGYLGPITGQGLDANRHIPFAFPPKQDGTSNMIACGGQSMTVNIPRCRALHLLMASDRDTSAEFVMTYETGAEQREQIPMSAWDKAPISANETVGYHTAVRNGPFGVERHDTYLKQYTILCDQKRSLSVVTLPNDPHIRILAITAESW